MPLTYPYNVLSLVNAPNNAYLLASGNSSINYLRLALYPSSYAGYSMMLLTTASFVKPISSANLDFTTGAPLASNSYYKTPCNYLSFYA